MNKITAAFQNGKAFIPFLTGGDTSASERTLLALMNAPSRARKAACCFA